MEKINNETIVYITVEVIIAFLSVLGNTILCFVVLSSDSIRKKPMYLFLTSLALADIFVGLVAIPFAILTKLGLPYDSPYLCIAMLTFIMILTQISIFNLMTVSIERYLAICYPRFHFNKMTKKLAIYLILSTWIISILVGLLPLGWNDLGSNDNSFLAPATDEHEINMTTSTNLDESAASQCIFLQVMDKNFLFFNFIACVLPPLLICAVLYFLIYLSLLEFRRPTKIKSARIAEKCFSVAPNNSHRDTDKSKKETNDVEQQQNSIEKKDTNSGIASSNVIFKEENNQKLDGIELTSLHGILGNKNKKSTRRSKENRNIKEGSMIYSDDCSLEIGIEPKTDISKHQQSKQRRLKTKREIHAAAVLGIIVLTFALCWLPIHILNTIVRFAGDEISIPEWLFSVAILLSHANSAVNFFLYSWRLKTFRRALHRTLSKVSNLLRN